jgi:hypothetical protein
MNIIIENAIARIPKKVTPINLFLAMTICMYNILF